MKHAPLAATVVLGLLVLAMPALAGGSWLHSTQASYNPGDHVIAVGYTEGLDSTAHVEYRAKLHTIPMDDETEANPSPTVDLGPVEIEETELRGYLRYRVFIEFDLPENLEPDTYYIEVTDETSNLFGDIVGMVVLVGIEPQRPAVIEWPLDEPLIANLAPDAILSGPGFQVTVTDLRAGIYPDGAAEFMYDPSVISEVAPEPVVSIVATSEIPPASEVTVASSSGTDSPTDVALPTERLFPTAATLWISSGLVVLFATALWKRRT